MRISRIQKNLPIPTRLAMVSHLRDTLTWLSPEKTNEEILADLIYELTLITDSEALTELLEQKDTQGIKKVDEVAELYLTFLNDNNNKGE